MYDNLPSWLKVASEENNKLTLRLINGSQIKATSAASDAGRSEAVSLLIIDEAAFIEGIEPIWASAQQTLATGGGAIVLSTPFGTGNWFHKTWTKAEMKDNNFLPIKLPWYVHPERDQAWRDKQDVELGDPRLAAQECFSEDVIVYTKYGPKYIKDIKIGDLVLSHDGTYNKVIRTMNSISNNVIKLKGGINNIEKFTTENHPFLNENNEWETVSSILNNSNMVKLFPNNIIDYKFNSNIIDLKDYIVANNPKYFPLKYNEDSLWLTKTNIINRKIEFDYDLGFLIGCFLSEGSLANNKVEFSFNGKTEREGFPLRIEEILSNKFNINNFSYYTSKRWEGSSKLYIKDQIFNNFIKLCIQGGNLRYQKSLSEFFYNNANEETLKGIIDGVLVGDGMLKKEYNISLLLTSEKLIYDILYINNILGRYNITLKKGKSINPKDKNKWRPNYTLTFLQTKIDSTNKIFSERVNELNSNQPSLNNFRFDREPLVKLKLEKYNKPLQVFNIEVENTHTYVTEYGIVHNCDCDFTTSGEVVYYPEHIEYYLSTHIIDPVERRGADKNLWIWESADYSRNYIVIADVARGDGKDYSAFHVFDIETNAQVAEYRSHMPPKEFGYFLCAIGTEYNEALLVVENSNVGWSTLDAILERGYRNLYYSPKSDSQTSDSYINKYEDTSKMTPGFTTSLKTRPLLINKGREYFGDRSVIIRSKRLIEEMKVFIWKNGRAEAQSGYNDDLVMSYSIGMYLRDTAIKNRAQGLELTRATLNNISTTPQYQGAYFSSGVDNPYHMNTRGGTEDIKWLL
jgi:hypothetical protein